MKNFTKLLIIISIIAVVQIGIAAQTTSWSYQGNLAFNGQPANGNFDFEFRVMNALVGGVTQSVTFRDNTPVVNGVFSVDLAGSGAFPGADRFLDIRVRPAGQGSFLQLSPRTPILSVPYAIQSLNATTATSATNATNATNAVTAVNVSGVVSVANGGTGSSTQNFVDLSTTQSVGGNKTFTGTINGNGSGLTNLNPSSLTPGTAGIDIVGMAAKTRTEQFSQTPTVAGLTTLVLNYPAFIEITDLTNGVEGQCITLISANGNPVINDALTFRLASNWDPLVDDTITLCRSSSISGPKWYERARSVNVNMFTLEVSKVGLGHETYATVTSSPSGIACGEDCSEQYQEGINVALTASVTPAGVFLGWSGGLCSGTGVCNVTMSQHRNVGAIFEPTQFTLTVSKSGSGTGTVTSSPPGIDCGSDCSQNYFYDTEVTLTASPTNGSTFTGWTGGGCSGTGTCVVTMTAATTVNATFSTQTFTLTQTRAGTGTGTVTSSPAGINCGADCSENYNSGTQVTLTATPAAGSTFSGWSGGGCTGTGTCVVTITSATTVTATFTLQTFTLTVSRSGTGTGTVTSSPSGINCGADCSEIYNFGTVVNLTPSPAAGSTFAGWSGACTGTGSCQVTMSQARSVVATFNLSN